MKSERKLNCKPAKSPKTKSFKSSNRRKPSEQLDLLLYDKFMTFMNNQRLNSLRSRLSQFYGKNFPVNYKKHYCFQQQWQNQKFKQEQKSEYQVINQVNLSGMVVSCLIMICYTLIIWFRNTELFFKQNSQDKVTDPVYAVGIGFQLADVAIKLWSKTKNQSFQFKIINILQLIYQNFIGIIFLILSIIKVNQDYSFLWLVFQTISLYFMYIRASQIYQSFRLTNIALVYEYQFKAFDLILNLIVIAHFIAIVLFQATKLGHQNSWILALNLGETDQFVKYAYSFYFCATTILTVGYGDISPKNVHEVMVVTFVQVFVIFAYLINEIGFSLSALRKGRQAIERELSLIQKMKRYYCLQQDLVHRARSYLINHKPKVDQLSPDQENSLMMKFNQQLRNQISIKNSMAVVKSCIFFLCRWTKAMQTAVSYRLVNVMFSPAEQVYQPEGKERIYIIRLGKIDIYTQRRGNRRGNKSVIKSIQSNLDKQVSDNCYGYTAVISTRLVRLYAISKDFTSGYFIEKQKFKECVNERAADFQYYHQIKDRIDQTPCYQSLEVPLLENSKKHYSPTHLHVIRRYRKSIKIKTHRQPWIRKERKSFRGPAVIYDIQFIKTIQRAFMPSLEQFNNLLQTSLREARKTISRKNIKSTLPFCQTSQDISLNPQTEYQIKRHFDHYFQESKQFSNYFPRNNLEQVINKFDNEYCFQIPEEQMQSICNNNTPKWRCFLSAAIDTVN